MNQFYNYKYILKFSDIPALTNISKYFVIIFNNQENGENNRVQLVFEDTYIVRELVDYKFHVKGLSHFNSDFFNDLGINFDSTFLYSELTRFFPLIKEVNVSDIFIDSNIPDHSYYFSLTIPVKIGINWREIINKLTDIDKVKIRSTGHKFRQDNRNIVWIEGFPLKREESVDSLGLNECLYEMEKHLCKLANIEWMKKE
jgi:hypothetical protein